MQRIGIVGAGISGLSAAWYLKRYLPGAQLDIFEREPRIGGVIETLDSPYLIECGADNFATLIPDALEMVRDMELESEFIAPQQNYRIAQVVHNGRLVPIPNGFSLMQPTRLGAILSTPLLSVRGKMRVMAECFVPRRRSQEDESVASFAIRRLGRECYERLVEPIVGGIFTAQAETLSMRAAMPQFVAMEQEHGSLIRAALAKRRSATAENRAAREARGARYDQFTAPRRGMTWWIEQMAAPVRSSLHLGESVRSVRRSPEGGWQIASVRSSTGDAKTWTVDHLIMAVPGYRAAEMMAGLSPELAGELSAIPYASSAIAVLAVAKREIRPEALCFGCIAPRIEKRDCLAISLTSEKYEGRCPPEMVLARVFMGGAVRPEIFDLPEDTLLSMARRELQTLFGPTSQGAWERLIRWPRAMPQYLVGHVDRVQRIREHVARMSGLELIGNAYDGVGIPQCVRGGKQAARKIADRCR